MKTFAVAPLGPAACISLAALVVVPAAITAGALVLSPEIDAATPWLIAVVVIVIMGAVVASARRRSVTLVGDELVIKAALYTRKVPLSRLEVATARVVSLDERIELRPMLRMNGFSVPGFHCGHYRLKELKKAFCMLTSRQRVLAIQETGGPLLLLSMERPQALLDAVRGR